MGNSSSKVHEIVLADRYKQVTRECGYRNFEDPRPWICAIIIGSGHLLDGLSAAVIRFGHESVYDPR